MSKRGQNEGTIFKEKPGRWVAKLTIGYEVVDGKRRRIRKKFTATSRKAVQHKLTEALRQQQTGGAVPIQKDTLGAFLGTWLKRLAVRGRREKTIQSYQWIVDRYIIPEIGTLPLTRLTQRDINDFMGAKLAAGLSNRTVRYCHAIIRSALTTAEKEGLVARNVAKLADPPPQTAGRVEPLTPEDARRVLAAVAGDRLEALYSVALAIGLRRGEIMGLNWASVDLDRGTLIVKQTAQRINGKGIVIEQAAKNLTSRRTIPLPAFAIAALSHHRERQQTERQFAGDQWKETGLVFTTSIGTPLEPSNLLRHFHGILEVLNIDRRRIHDLRHTAASLLLAQGATLHEVKEILGHSQIALTANLYGHAYTSVLRGTVDRVGSLLSPENPVGPSMGPSTEKPKVN
jgi:integrase